MMRFYFDKATIEASDRRQPKANRIRAKKKKHNVDRYFGIGLGFSATISMDHINIS